MFPPGHVGIALLVYAPVAYLLILSDRNRKMEVGIAAILLLTLLPDFDILIPGVTHRGLTHSLLAGVVLGVAVGLFGWLSRVSSPVERVERAVLGWLLGFLGVVSHIVGDVITPMGIRPYEPMLPAHYTLALVHARNPAANFVLFVAGIAIFHLVVQRALVRSPTSEPGGIVYLPLVHGTDATASPTPGTEADSTAGDEAE